MLLKYNLNEQDYIEYSLFKAINDPAWNKRKKINTIAGAFLIICALILFFAETYVAAIAFTLIAASFFFSSSQRWISRLAKKNIKKLLLDEKNKGLFNERTFELKENGFELTTGTRKSMLSYAEITKVYLDDKFVYIDLNLLDSTIIPVRTFQTENEKIDFVNFLKTKAKIL